MSDPFSVKERRDYDDQQAAHAFAATILNLLFDCIPAAARHRAGEILITAAREKGFDLTTTAMRKHYEVWRDTQIATLNMLPITIVQPKDE